MGLICSPIAACCSTCSLCASWSNGRTLKETNKKLDKYNARYEALTHEIRRLGDDITAMRKGPRDTGTDGGNGGTTVVIHVDEPTIRRMQAVLDQKYRIRQSILMTIIELERVKSDCEMKQHLPDIQKTNKFITKHHVRNSQAFLQMNHTYQKLHTASEIRFDRQKDFDDTMGEITDGPSIQDMSTVPWKHDPAMADYTAPVAASTATTSPSSVRSATPRYLDDLPRVPVRAPAAHGQGSDVNLGKLLQLE